MSSISGLTTEQADQFQRFWISQITPQVITFMGQPVSDFHIGLSTNILREFQKSSEDFSDLISIMDTM